MSDVTVIKKDEKTIKIRLKSLDLGGGNKKYNTSGFHIKEEHRHLLPERGMTDRRGTTRQLLGKKIEPGYIYELPESVAIEYLKSSSKFLEQVYD